MKRSDRKMKLIDMVNMRLEMANNQSEPFDGSLEGVPITAAFNWTQTDKEFVYFFAGRNLCKQEISLEWVPMCDIKDIADWLNCPKINAFNGPEDRSTDDSFPLTLVIVLALDFIVLVIILLIVFLWFYKTKLNEKPKSEPIPQQIASTDSQSLDAIRTGAQ